MPAITDSIGMPALLAIFVLALAFAAYFGPFDSRRG
jgi:hypothetical protein